MKVSSIKEGLMFASRHALTKREMEVLILLLERPKSNQVISDELKSPKTTVHHIIIRLKLKGLIGVKDRDATGTNMYEITLNKEEDKEE